MKSPFDSPLSGFRSPFAYNRRLGGALAAYAVANFTPKLVFDFETETYATGGAVSTFDDSITYTGDSLKTMVDTDGVLKWAPHNYFNNSEDVTNWHKLSQNLVETDGAPDFEGGNRAISLVENTNTGTHQIGYDGKLSLDLTKTHTQVLYVKRISGNRNLQLQNQSNSNAEQWTFDLTDVTATSTFGTSFGYSGTIESIGDDWFKCSLVDGKAIPGTLRVFIRVVDGTSDNYTGDGTSGLYIALPHLYRSDLGGMVNNPDRGDSYVPTTDSPVYLPRRGHHVYDGTSYVNEGLLVESEARTNLFLDSEDMTSGNWGNNRTTIAASGDGWFTLTQDATDFDGNVNQNISIGAGETMTISIDARYVDRPYLFIRQGLENGQPRDAYFNIQTGDLGPKLADHTAQIVELDDGYRCSVTFANDGTARTGLTEFFLNEDTISAVTVDGGKLDLRRPQAEVVSTPSSYIPTAGAALTRDGETRDSDNLTYDSAAMWFTMAGAETYADADTAGQVTLFDWRADANNRITVSLDTDGTETGEITLTMVSGGTSWTVAADYLSPGILQSFNIAWRVTSSEINLAVGGTAATAVSVTSIPDLSTATASFAGNGTRKLFRQSTGDIGDAGLEEAST